MVVGPHPESVIRTAEGREVQLKVHQCVWSGAHPANSLPAIEECYRLAVARVEIDVCLLRDADFLVVHERELEESTDGSGLAAELSRHQARTLRLVSRGRVWEERPPLFSDVVALIRGQAYPTLMELDLKDVEPMPWPRVEELARLVEPVTDRVIFNSQADWNLRRLLRVDPTLPVSFDPAGYLDSPAERPDEDEARHLPHGAYGYLDAHPLARARLTSVADYLADRLGGILRLVPGAREAHLRLRAFERMLDDGVADAARLFHEQGMLLDVWTLDAQTPRWRQRLMRALAAGVDVITTNTAQALAAAGATPTSLDEGARADGGAEWSERRPTG